jgi:hypothetical protein
VYARTVQGQTLSFGVSGMLWRENLIMYDRQTDSWWAQATGRAIVGKLKGAALTLAPSSMMRWRDWKRMHPETLVLSKTANGRTRGTSDNYASYHGSSNIGVTGRLGFKREALAAKTRIVGFRFADRAYAVDLDVLKPGGVMISTVADEQFVIAATPDGSAARVFRARSHAFAERTEGGVTRLVDTATGSVWNGFEGRATSGKLSGTTLEEVPVTLSYWFAWRAFFPDVVLLKR